MAAYSKRCMISHRPPFRTKEPVFYRCPECESVYVRNGGNFAPDESGVSKDSLVVCCKKELSPLIPLKGDKIPEGHRITFTVFGGFEENAVRVSVDDGGHPMNEDHSIEWMYLRTFQGGHLKYLPLKGRSIATFALADEDAYVYCDRDICRMGREPCQFVCKRGNIIYAYCSVHGLMMLELEGIHARERD